MSLFSLSKQETRQTTPDEIVKAILNTNIKVNSKVLYNDINLYRLSNSIDQSDYLYGTQRISFVYDSYDNSIRVHIPNSAYFYFLQICESHIVMFEKGNLNEIVIQTEHMNAIDFFQYECLGVYNIFSVPVLMELVNYLKGYLNND